MDVITTVFTIIAAYFIGSTIIEYMNHRQAVKTANHDAMVSYLNGIIRQVKVETHHGVKYWFDDENDKFLAQGATNEEIYLIIKERFPDHVFLLPEGSVLCAPIWKPVADSQALCETVTNRFSK